MDSDQGPGKCNASSMCIGKKETEIYANNQ